LLDQARLADTRLGDDRDKAARALSGARRDLIGKDCEFPRASHKWAVVPSLDTFRLSCRDEPVGRYALCFPLQLEGLDGLDLDGGSDGAERVVLVDAGKAEDGHDRVADVLLDRSAVALECPTHLIEVARHDLAYRLRVELLRHRRRSLEIGEDDRHGLSYFLWR